MLLAIFPVKVGAATISFFEGGGEVRVVVVAAFQGDMLNGVRGCFKQDTGVIEAHRLVLVEDVSAEKLFETETANRALPN